MKLMYDEFQEHWIWVSLENDNNELSLPFDTRTVALKWVFDVVQALVTL